MSTPSERYLKGIPTKPYDLLKEILVILAIILVVVIILAAAVGSPDYPTIKAQDVANLRTIDYVKTCTDILAGNASIQDYGPPYNAETENSQRFLGVAPGDWPGVTIPVDPRQDFILGPLERVAILNQNTAEALRAFKAAGSDQQNTWANNYLTALDGATLVNGQVQAPDGDYGPVPVMMNGMLLLGKSGLLDGALQNNSQTPYVTDMTNSLLFFQDDIYAGVADQMDLTSPQWGIVHETGNYPGAWWLWPYAIFYHIPPMSSSANGDIQVGVIVIALVLILIFLPFIPGLNRIPHGVRLYRWIWRDWYAGQKK